MPHVRVEVPVAGRSFYHVVTRVPCCFCSNGAPRATFTCVGMRLLYFQSLVPLQFPLIQTTQSGIFSGHLRESKGLDNLHGFIRKLIGMIYLKKMILSRNYTIRWNMCFQIPRDLACQMDCLDKNWTKICKTL